MKWDPRRRLPLLGTAGPLLDFLACLGITALFLGVVGFLAFR